MGLDNDTRGWIMAAVSGIACTVGASIICIDVIIRQLPGKKHFKIEDSNAFLSSGLSLSFGVMIFSSLYSMLPSAKSYLEKGGLNPKQAAFTLIGCFLIGALGISVLSRILHSFIPHSVVDCDHDHDDEDEASKEPDEVQNGQPHAEPHSNTAIAQSPIRDRSRGASYFDGSAESIPSFQSSTTYGAVTNDDTAGLGSHGRRPSFQHQLSSKVSELVTGSKEYCDKDGQCFGYSNPCGSQCFKIIQKLTGPRSNGHASGGRAPTRPSGLRTVTLPAERQGLLENVDEYSPLVPTKSGPPEMESTSQSETLTNGHSNSTSSTLRKQQSSHSVATQASAVGSHESSHPHVHHHHVPTNVFLSIGLQTSIAIALHKLPEGFITYATNHANPRLGFAVFLALFIHNITEGFAMALPLYLAINSRWKAMFWSALLGGVTQPMGAGIAALWFRIAGSKQGGSEPGEKVYGAMFAVTSGIMAMVGLQLFGESLDLTHSRKLCFGFAFVGMGVLGLSSALTA